ncbi:DUF4232 domain-containing protein [Streptomyces sp. LaPpAH-108]|uniref:DUF4232 domain-containing protein n=1 Tax=Streptomyces sp. LaPpAH-108 TaxID=1155714 RepID=UPI0004782606|nr:DUF4232 domain-containing protein [Streptomyces sp. LaPpAH-108]
MRRSFADRVAVGTLAGAVALVLAGCGTQQADPRAGGGASGGPSCPSATPTPGSTPPLTRPTATVDAPRPPGTPSPVPSAANSERDGVRVTGVYSGVVDREGVCRPNGLTAAFSVSGTAAREMTYTIIFDADGYTGVTRIVGPVRPGKTLRGTVAIRRSVGEPVSGPQVSVVSVRSVQTAEAPSENGPCPASGVRVWADRGDAAMGLRVTGLHLENCGTSPYTLDGRPQLQLLDADHKTVEGIRLVPGDEVANLDGSPDVVRPVTLNPGERARATIAWRNTVQTVGAPVNAPYLRVRAKPGAAPVMVTPELDLGTTGKLGVRAWQKE